jgi:hypothetical protein
VTNTWLLYIIWCICIRKSLPITEKCSKIFLVQFIVYGSPACGHYITAVFMMKYRSLIVSVLEQFSKPVVSMTYDYYKTNIISLCILLYVNLKRSPSRCLSFSLEIFGNF